MLIAGQTWTSANAYLTTTFVAATQGRYYFPAIVCLIALSAVAWRRIPRSAGGRRGLATLLAAGSVVLGWYGLGVVAAWFWNAARGPLGPQGAARWATAGPVPLWIVGVLLVVVAVAQVLAVVQVARTPGTTDGAEPVPEHEVDAVGEGSGRP